MVYSRDVPLASLLKIFVGSKLLYVTYYPREMWLMRFCYSKLVADVNDKDSTIAGSVNELIDAVCNN